MTAPRSDEDSAVGKRPAPPSEVPRQRTNDRRGNRQQTARRSPHLAVLTLADIRARRAALMAEETRVSYWRRILQARLDVLLAKVSASQPTMDLAGVLADARGSHSRVAHLTLVPTDYLEPLPDLEKIWRKADLADGPTERAAAAEALRAAEAELSAWRAELHLRLDALTAELIARYREDPARVLSALPLSRH